MPKSSKAKLEWQAERNAQPAEKKQRAEYNRVRREAIAEGRVKVGDGKDLAHKKAVDAGGSNAPSNIKVQDASTNRAWRAREPELYTKRK